MSQKIQWSGVLPGGHPYKITTKKENDTIYAYFNVFNGKFWEYQSNVCTHFEGKYTPALKELVRKARIEWGVLLSANKEIKS